MNQARISLFTAVVGVWARAPKWGEVMKLAGVKPE